MNWKEIREKCPKAYRLMWMSGVLDLVKYYNGEPNFIYSIRQLYDFFDSEGMVIEIRLAYDAGENIWFEYAIYKETGHCLFTTMDEPDYKEPYKTKTRTEAEEAAFTKAFDILENKLEGKK